MWDKNIKETKMKKLQRDTTDFFQNRVYKWKRIVTHTRQRTKSVSSAMSSGMKSSAGSQYSEGHRTRRNKRKNVVYPRRNEEERATENGGQKLKVINLSNVILTDAQVEVLSLGLSFSPAAVRFFVIFLFSYSSQFC